MRCHRWNAVPAATLALALVLVLAPAGGSRAGGGSFGGDDDDDKDASQSFYGFVKDKDGTPVEGAKITLSVADRNWTIIVRTDSQGHFFVKGLDKTIDAGTIDVACAKDGYREAAHARKPSLDPNAPIEIDCVLEQQ